MTGSRERRWPRRHPLIPAAALLLGLAAGCNSSTAPLEQELDLEVAAQRVPCTGVGPQECLVVRESPDEAWVLFHGGIEGFTHETGFRYVLRVAERRVPDPPADGSSLAYRLVRIVSRTPSP